MIPVIQKPCQFLCIAEFGTVRIKDLMVHRIHGIITELQNTFLYQYEIASGIGLMRTLGCSNIAVYREYTVEQLICITAGTLSGNALYQWKAMDKAAMLIGLYVLGLSIALMVFMRSNLLMQLKEDE